MKAQLICCLVFLISSFNYVQSQSNLNQQESKYTYIFRINEEQAYLLHQNPEQSLKSDYFKQPIDSFPSKESYKKELSSGHYLQSKAKKNLQETYYTSVQDFQVFVFNNAQDLIIQVVDQDAKPIFEADVELGKKSIKFRENQQAYVVSKANLEGVLKVKYQGQSAFFQLSKQKNSSWVNRNSKKLAYQYPTKYLWLPIEYLAMLPYDAGKSIKHGRSVGKIERTQSFFKTTGRKIGCWFNPEGYWCTDQEKYEVGYFVLSQPKYKSKDTIRGKAFVWNDKSKPLDEKLNLVLYKSYNDQIVLTEISPYRKGAYDFQMELHDSLDLRLDKNYSLVLEDKNNQRVGMCYFTYEEYELKKNSLEINSNKTKHYRNDELTLSINARNDNEMRLPDAKVKLKAIAKNGELVQPNQVFVPNLLWEDEIELATNQTTKITLPDSIFPPLNLNYTIEAELRTSDFELTKQSLQQKYLYKSNAIDYQLHSDSLKVNYLSNGQQLATDFVVEAEDLSGEILHSFEATSPFQFKINPLVANYQLMAGEEEKTIQVDQMRSGINAFLQKKKDSVFVRVQNPNAIKFHYHFFRKNKLIAEGEGEEFHYATKEKRTNIDYSITLSYLWGGKVIERNFMLAHHDQDLKVDVQQPQLVYPGQEAEISIEVTDHENKVVENADVLAFGVTKKFDYNPQPIRNFSTAPKPRKIFNEFELNSLDESLQEELNFDFWKHQARLDQLDYYRLLYPENQLEVLEIPIENQPTQFAPFVVENGQFVPIQIIYLNQKPIYFSAMTNQQAFSFPVAEHPVNLELRTKNYSIQLDSIQFKPGHKSILSIDLQGVNKLISVENASDELTEYERLQLIKYVFPIKTNPQKFSYISNQDRYFLTEKKPRNYSTYTFIGPIHHQDLSFHQQGKEAVEFQHEPAYLFEFLPQQIKQKTLGISKYPEFLSSTQIPQFEDLALTKDRAKTLEGLDLLRTKQNKRLANYPTTTSRGNATLKIEHDYLPANILLQELEVENPTLRLYHGFNKDFHDLSPGKYRLIFIYNNNNYSLIPPVEVQANGTTYLPLEELQSLRFDRFSEEISKLVNQQLLKSGILNETELKRLEEDLKENINELEIFLGDYFEIKGLITDENNIPLPGADVIVEGTNYGTQTDFDGYFEVRVPEGYKELKVKYLGFKSLFIPVQQSTTIQGQMKPDAEQHLNDEVITAYRVEKKQEAKVRSEVAGLVDEERIYLSKQEFMQVLQGKVSGINKAFGSGIPGASGTTIIRGKSSTISSGNKPLIIVNGVLYEGDLSSIAIDLIEETTILRQDAAQSIYGNRGVNGVILITTSQKSFELDEESSTEPEFASPAQDAKSIRDNFQDLAYWNPNLQTDEEGKLNFTITYPDDITSWDHFFYVATPNQQTGQVRQNINSYKPLMAQLNVPQFLIAGDTVVGIGKNINVVKDSVEIETQFFINDVLQWKKNKAITGFSSDELRFSTTQKDSLQLKYQLFQSEKDYTDGEEVKIPVFKKGMQQTDGEFFVLSPNEELKLKFNPEIQNVNLEVYPSFQHIIDEELDLIIRYPHNCNEQMASRLKAFLLKKQLYAIQNKDFKEDQVIKKLIQLLQKNQQSNLFWGWWENSEANLWATLNVVEALQLAKEEAYKVSFNQKELTNKLSHLFFRSEVNKKQIRYLEILDQLQASIDYLSPIDELLKIEDLALHERFQLLELYQKQGGKISEDQILTYKKENLLGNWYFEEKTLQNMHPYSNTLQQTLIAYRILKAIKAEPKTLEKIRNYLIEQRKSEGYANTFEAITVISTLLEEVDSFNESHEIQMKKNNSDWVNIEENPDFLKVEASDEVVFQHNASLPIYINYTQSFWEQEPEAKKESFQLHTEFKNKNGELIQAEEIQLGEEFSLEVNLSLQKRASYVMIEVPIPSGCSFSSKKQFPGEAHRSYAKDRVFIFVEELPPGDYNYQIDLNPRYSGKYTLNPAQAKLMYFKQYNGNNTIKELKFNSTF